MMKRVHALVVLAALFSLVVLGGCTAEETSTSNGADSSPVSTDGGPAAVDLSNVNLKDAVNAQMSAAADEGNYGCCLMMPCSQCIVNMGMCPCGMNAKDGKGVCHECKGGWAAGDGAIEDLTADDVMVMPRGGM